MNRIETAWRVLGPVWATFVTLIVAFPVTVPALSALLWRVRKGTGSRFWRTNVLPALLPVPLLWAWAALLRSHDVAATVNTGSIGVVVLLLLQLALLGAAWRRGLWGRMELAWILPVLWVGVVASFIALWWVQGWASL